MDKVLSGIVKEIAEKYSLDTKEVEMILNMPYKMMRDTIQALELHGPIVGCVLTKASSVISNVSPGKATCVINGTNVPADIVLLHM